MLEERFAKIAEALARSIRSAPDFDSDWEAVIDAPSGAPPPLLPTSASGASEVTLDADALTALLKTGARPDALEQSRKLLRTLQRDRNFTVLVKLGQAILEHDPNDDDTALLYARALIETGQTSKAQRLLTRLAQRGRRDPAHVGKVTSLLGRIYKERFVTSARKTSKTARAALTHAIKAYQQGYQADAENIWHGVNVVALLAAARRHRIKTGVNVNEVRLAYRLAGQLEQKPESLRTTWDIESLAELYLAQGALDLFGELIKQYSGRADVAAFAISSFLRHLTDVWELESNKAAALHLAFLRAHVLSMPGGSVDLGRGASPSPPVPAAALAVEPVFGQNQMQSLDWFQRGLDRSRSVGLVLDRSGRAYGTCFLVRARDFGIGRDECLALTTAHVVSSKASSALKPKLATIRFGDASSPRTVRIVDEVWTSQPDRLDATLLRFEPPLPELLGLPLASKLPSLEVPQRVYTIGYPAGRQATFSLQDNDLLDHEGPPERIPARPGIVRLHYRAPTDAGSSGSPLFDSEWQVIGLHRFSRTELPRLHGRPGTYNASEGIRIQSIAQAKRQSR